MKDLIFNDRKLWYKTYTGRYVQVTAIFTSVPDSNEYMEKYDTQSCLAVVGECILIVDKHDKGKEIKWLEK